MKDEYDTVVDFAGETELTGNRVAICGLFRSRGGASRVVEQQAIDLTEAGYDVSILALEADMEPPDDVRLCVVNPIQDHRILSKVYWLLFPLLPSLWYTVWKLWSVDMIIAHRYPFSVAGYVVSRFGGVTYTYWSHPSSTSADEFSGLARIWSRLIQWFERGGRAIEGADYICAVSYDSKEYLASNIDEPVIVVPNKVNERRFAVDVDLAAIRDTFGLNQSGRVVLFVGRITERKNIGPLIDIVDRLSADIPDIELVVAGSVSQPDYGESLKARGGPSVTFTGYVTDEELAGLYTIADVFATSSLEEGWGLPISEAQYFDTPVVAFRSHPAAKMADERILVAERDYEAFEEALASILGNGTVAGGR